MGGGMRGADNGGREDFCSETEDERQRWAGEPVNSGWPWNNESKTREATARRRQSEMDMKAEKREREKQKERRHWDVYHSTTGKAAVRKLWTKMSDTVLVLSRYQNVIQTPIESSVIKNSALLLHYNKQEKKNTNEKTVMFFCTWLGWFCSRGSDDRLSALEMKHRSLAPGSSFASRVRWTDWCCWTLSAAAVHRQDLPARFNHPSLHVHGA